MVRLKKYKYFGGEAHKIFPNLINREFKASILNQKWLTDFTYMYLIDEAKRYNCKTIDLYDRNIIATLNSQHIDAKLAIVTLKKGVRK